MAEIVVRSNNIENIILGQLTAKWSARGDRILRYYLDVRHTKLNLHRELSAPEIFILQGKADALIASWDEKYADFQVKQKVVSGKQAADDLTAKAVMKLASLHRILAHTLTVDDAVDWEALKDRRLYPKPNAFLERKPEFVATSGPVYAEPKITWWQSLLGKKSELIAAATKRHHDLTATWEAEEAGRLKKHHEAEKDWEARQTSFWSEHNAAEEKFLAEQEEGNAKVDGLRIGVGQGDVEAVVEHASMVLEASDYDNLFEKGYEIQYDKLNRTLLISYELPAPADMPIIKAVKFAKATGELVETIVGDREQKTNFESVIYQICLRTIHEVIESDTDGNYDKILFNGFVTAVDAGTGQEVRSCILSLLAEKSAFAAIDLSRVDPKACFKNLKGVSAASLAALSPIPPIMEMDREDRRFVEGRSVAGELNDGINLATISWDDFEHLVREVFEHEFRSRGGEVKVTQASSDGGVDAIAFDPDPISGGKIVIQAKRYTRTVGVSAVRDLYGTVLNEGASKGILVTTSDYGPDAYKFANGKPITLMSGAHLLHLMQKHGQRGHIDIRAARDAMAKTLV